MKLSHFFIDRPIFAIVISVVTVLLGCIAFLLLPVAQFPDITPPTIVVTAEYPGADPKTLSEEVAQPIDREKVQTLGVPLNSIFTTLQSYLGTNYVNDFNFLGRTFQVNLQGNPDFRWDPSQSGSEEWDWPQGSQRLS
jgi:multidrug efflux pump subunit AcrB